MERLLWWQVSCGGNQYFSTKHTEIIVHLRTKALKASDQVSRQTDFLF